MCEKQFPAEHSHKANMYGRAMRLYNESKEKVGIIQADVMKPETMAHFHIEAFGDKIECNRYESHT